MFINPSWFIYIINSCSNVICTIIIYFTFSSKITVLNQNLIATTLIVLIIGWLIISRMRCTSFDTEISALRTVVIQTVHQCHQSESGNTHSSTNVQIPHLMRWFLPFLNPPDEVFTIFVYQTLTIKYIVIFAIN